MVKENKVNEKVNMSIVQRGKIQIKKYKIYFFN